MLFQRKNPLLRDHMEPRCEYCQNASGLNAEDKVLCRKRGAVSAGGSCRAFRYDPTRRVPPKPAILRHNYAEEDLTFEELEEETLMPPVETLLLPEIGVEPESPPAEEAEETGDVIVETVEKPEELLDVLSLPPIAEAVRDQLPPMLSFEELEEGLLTEGEVGEEEEGEDSDIELEAQFAESVLDRLPSTAQLDELGRKLSGEDAAPSVSVSAGEPESSDGPIWADEDPDFVTTFVAPPEEEERPKAADDFDIDARIDAALAAADQFGEDQA